eukprot:scaffold174_cov99-Isochrysis_galbana.AAC.2
MVGGAGAAAWAMGGVAESAQRSGVWEGVGGEGAVRGAFPRKEVEHAAVLSEPEEAHLIRGRVVGHHLRGGWGWGGGVQQVRPWGLACVGTHGQRGGVIRERLGARACAEARQGGWPGEG